MLYQDYLKNKKPYQEDGLLLLLERKHACLFYKPGKGKTYPTVDATREVDKYLNGNAKVLVLSTADAIKNMWLPEIDKQNIMPKNTVYMSFNSAIQDRTKAQLLAVKWNVLIVDECHKIKAHNTKTSKLVYQLSRNIEYVWGLSGTPRGNTDVDIFCQFHNMRISEWGDITYTHFTNSCCDLEQKFFNGQMVRIPTGINSRYKAGWERNVAMYSQRVEYDDCDNMPDLTVNLVEFDYKPTKEYLQAEEGVISIADYESTMTKLAAVTKLHQIVNGFAYIYNENDERVTYEIEHNEKLNWLVTNVYIHKPTTIVYRFEADKQFILDQFRNHCTENVEDFKQGKHNILLLQCSRCESFNLQMCKHMIFYTLDYSYIKYNQMLHRIWRMGQTDDVKVDVLIHKDTVETKIWNAIQNKEKFANLFMSIKGV